MTKNNIKIVVVEDEPILLKDLVNKINRCRPDVEVVAYTSNPREALQLLQTLKPNILITDIQMPEMTGLELIKKAKAVLPHLNAAIISGYSDFHYAQEAIRYHVIDYLLKPVEMESLKDFLDRFCLSFYDIPEELSLNFADSIEQYITEHYQEPLTLSDLSEIFNYAPSSISHVFKKEKGTSPIRWLTNIRLEKAKSIMLSTPNCDIKKVAELVGYTDARYFSRIFKQLEGRTPSEWMTAYKSDL